MRQLLTISLTLFCIVAYAQKPNINKAKALYDKGELSEAKTIIDQAIVYEKTMGKAKTWYYRGLIYATLDTLNKEPGALEAAMESFKKTIEIDPDQKSVSEFTSAGISNVDSRIQSYYGYYYNEAIDSYQAEDFAAATENFEKAFYIMPSDTNAIMNAAYAATAMEDEERAKTNLKKAIESGATDRNLYLRLYNYAIQAEQLDEALSIIRSAREVHPNDVNIQKYEINILIQQEKVDEAKAGIENAIAKEPNNPDLHFSLGVIHEELKALDEARASYKKAMEIDPNHFNSTFNLGVMVFNESNELIKERNALSYKEEKKYNELSRQINERLTEALPYWEKLYELNGTDETVLETLKYIYVNLKMNDKAEKIADELDAVKG